MADILVQDASKSLLDRLEGAANDKRAENLRFRQHQLLLLHKCLRGISSQICKAIAEDTGGSEQEAHIEYYLAMLTIRELYNPLDMKQSIKNEYLIAHSHDNIDRRIPYGLVLVRPQSYTRFYSIVSAVAAAIAAGNCVLLELEPSLRQVDRILKIELKVQDQTTFAIATTRVQDARFLSKCLIVDQTSESQFDQVNSLHTNPRPVLAVVDRNANVDAAAAAICKSRLSFGGASPHAPDLVLVNEWRKQPFIAACLRQLSDGASVLASSTKRSKQQLKRSSKLATNNANVLFDSAGVQLVELLDCDASILSEKITEHRILFYATTGLVDTVTIAEKWAPYLVTYHFTDAPGGKFLSQYIESRVTFVNQIPTHVLVGPAFPSTWGPSNLELRYDVNVMTRPRPEKINPPSLSFRLVSDIVEGKVVKPADQDLLKAATTPLKGTGQGSGRDIGTFGRGVIIGIVVYILPTIGLISYSTFKAGQFGWHLLNSKSS